MSTVHELALTLRQLRAFDAAAATGSFTQAARQIYITQSGLSVLIRELEDQLGASLFHRTTRRVELTDAGRAFQPHVRRILSDLSEASAAVADIRDKRRGILRLAVPQLFASTVIPAVLQPFHQRFPGVEIQLQDFPVEQVLERVGSGDAELALGPDPGTFRTELDWVPIVADRHWLVCHPQALPAKVRSVRWEALRGMRFISPTRDFADRLASFVGEECRPLLEQPHMTVTTFPTAFGLVSAGFGVTLSPTYARNVVAGYGLRMVKIEGDAFAREVCVWSRKNRQWSPAARDFVQTLKDTVAANPLFQRPRPSDLHLAGELAPLPNLETHSGITKCRRA